MDIFELTTRTQFRSPRVRSTETFPESSTVSVPARVKPDLQQVSHFLSANIDDDSEEETVEIFTGDLKVTHASHMAVRIIMILFAV
jgi:hypothetical protein